MYTKINGLNYAGEYEQPRKYMVDKYKKLVNPTRLENILDTYFKGRMK